MRKQCLFLLLFAVILAVPVYSETTFKLIKRDGRYLCEGSVVCKNNDKSTFGSAVLWALDQSGDVNEQKTYDAAGMTLQMRPVITVGEDASRNYSFNLTLQVKDGRIVFLIDQIRCVPKGIIGGFMQVNFDKINLTKKPKLQEYIDEFDVLCNRFVLQMIAKIQGKNVKLNHWEAITSGLIVKGMSGDECILAVGKPGRITENSQRTQWLYESGMIIVFEKGIVMAVVK